MTKIRCEEISALYGPCTKPLLLSNYFKSACRDPLSLLFSVCISYSVPLTLARDGIGIASMGTCTNIDVFCLVFVCVCVCLHLSSVVYQDGFYGADIYVSIRMPSLNVHIHTPPFPRPVYPSDYKPTSWFIVLSIVSIFWILPLLIVSRDFHTQVKNILPQPAAAHEYLWQRNRYCWVYCQLWWDSVTWNWALEQGMLGLYSVNLKCTYSTQNALFSWLWGVRLYKML